MAESNEIVLPSIFGGLPGNILALDVREFLDELSERSGIPRNTLINFIVRDFRDNARTMTVLIA